ncbi:MAG: hypothetical protein DRQ13_07490, partial [Ignavibacteriae bacterium]
MNCYISLSYNFPSQKMIDKLSQIALNDVILDSMPGIAYIFTKDGFLIAWNKRMEDILGYSKDELQNKFVLDFIDEAYQENVLREVQNVFSHGYAQAEYEIVTKTGKRIHYLGTGAVAEIDSKEYMIGLAQDITELNTAREKIKSQVDEIKRLNETMRAENIYLKDQL